MRKLLPIFSAMLLCTPLYAAQPAEVHAQYDLLYGSIKGATVEETFSLKQDHYKIESVSRAIGLVALFKPEVIRVTSEGLLTTHGLQPLIFASTRKLDADRNARADFDWPHQQITLTDNKGKRTLPLPHATQDRLSAMYQFMFLSLKNVNKLDFHMTNGNKVDIYNYTLTPGKTVSTPLGTFKAIYVASPIEPGNSRTEIWLATEHQNFPYKMVVTDPDGTRITQVLTHFDIAP